MRMVIYTVKLLMLMKSIGSSYEYSAARRGNPISVVVVRETAYLSSQRSRQVRCYISQRHRVPTMTFYADVREIVIVVPPKFTDAPRQQYTAEWIHLNSERRLMLLSERNLYRFEDDEMYFPLTPRPGNVPRIVRPPTHVDTWDISRYAYPKLHVIDIDTAQPKVAQMRTVVAGASIPTEKRGSASAALRLVSGMHVLLTRQISVEGTIVGE
ncbi:hypothetical protein BDW22DRAFT_1348948 [Trametopsis cervina]|nr:hypothetical protein BDW22DRAFT_1348948 [Trametopsis cervina]